MPQPQLATDTVWRKRLEDIESDVSEIRLPNKADDLGQDKEWCEVEINGKRRRIRFHDYGRVFEVPGLYEQIFYEELECCSPSYIANLLQSVVQEYGENLGDLRVLDLGAGNGMVGDELHDRGIDSIVGVDIIPEAKEATERDRPEVYEDYRVADLTDCPEPEEHTLRQADANCLTTVAACGFGDIPPLAFAKGLDLISTPGWLAFNIKEDFLRERDTSGFSRLIRRLSHDGFIQMLCYRRYQHRVSVTGEPLFYVAVVARKLKDLDEAILESLQEAENG
ncbi:hypothetical protein Pan216_41860 [Planctomycetes bacterium Pan216]|uniref:Methyltransferase type 11 domain-containing protein n=1 Tax=Kolteria novifilia TaxID=2527975 RepID=A0A518B8K8_9BACT|nr:hypothetical protein Pan216_41860 [Planctomycetes bacterium Pan216]